MGRRGLKAGLALVLTLGALLGALVPAAWSRLNVLTNHTGSKLGGYQTLIARHKGHIVLGVGFVHRSGRYRLCVDDPAGRRVCHRFRLVLNEQRTAFLSFIYWSQRFPVNGGGHYEARWFKAGKQLGPKLGFEV